MRRTSSLQHDTSLCGRLWLPAGQKGGKQPINQKNTITTVTITIMLQRSGSDFTHHHQHYQLYQLLGGPQGVKGQSGRSCGAVSLTVTAEICIQQCPDLPGFLICKCQAKRRYRGAVESRHSHSASGGLGITGCSQSGWEKKERKEKKNQKKKKSCHAAAAAKVPLFGPTAPPVGALLSGIISNLENEYCNNNN